MIPVITNDDAKYKNTFSITLIFIGVGSSCPNIIAHSIMNLRQYITDKTKINNSIFSFMFFNFF